MKKELARTPSSLSSQAGSPHLAFPDLGCYKEIYFLKMDRISEEHASSMDCHQY